MTQLRIPECSYRSIIPEIMLASRLISNRSIFRPHQSTSIKCKIRPHVGIRPHPQVQVSGHIQATHRYQATSKYTHKCRYQATYPKIKCTYKCRYWSDNIQTQLAIGHTQDISNQLRMSLLFTFPSTILSSNSQELYKLCWRKCTIMVLFLINSLTDSALSHGVLAMILCFRISQKA